MIVRITFKTPDAVSYALDRIFTDSEAESGEGSEQEDVLNAINKFVKYGECITIEFDTDKGTATVIPVRS